MKKLESSLTNMVTVLVAVAVITAGLLAWVNQITAEPIRLQDELALANGIKSVMGLDELTVSANDTLVKTIDGKDYTFIVHKVNNSKDEFVGAAVESLTMGFGGELKVLVGFDTQGKVSGYTLLQHAETPGLGAKADRWFQRGGKGDIIGHDMKNDGGLQVSKDGGKVDAITASTITSRAFLKAVNQAYSVYADQNVDAHSGATPVKEKNAEEDNNQHD